MYLSMRKIEKMFSHTSPFILIILYSLTLVSCNPSLNGLVTINDGNDQMQEESSSYLHFARIPDEDDARKILLQMGNKSVHANTDDLDLSASASMAQILTNVNDNEQRNLQQQLQTNEDPLQRILPKVRFDCKDRKEGYYADVDFNCEVFHYCKSNGYRFTLVCPIKSRYSMKAMTCVYEDHKLYECPGVDLASTTNLSSVFDPQTTTLQSLTTDQSNRLLSEESTVTTTNSSIVDKNQMLENNKMSAWNEIINRSNKHVNNPTQLNNNDIMESLNQITTTLSSTKLNDDIIINLNANTSDLDTSNSTSSSIYEQPPTSPSSTQFGTRFNNNSGKTVKVSSTLKKASVAAASSPGYEDLYTKYQKRKKYKTTTLSSTSLDTADSGNSSGGDTDQSTENFYPTKQSSNNTNDRTMMHQQSTEQSTATNEQLYSTSSNVNEQSSGDNNHRLNHHHVDYKEINDQQAYQFAYQQQQQTSNLAQPIKVGQMVGEMIVGNQNSNQSATIGTSTSNQFDNQFDRSTSSDSGFKPIFMQTLHHHHSHQIANRPAMNQFKFVNSQLSIIGQQANDNKEQLDTSDNTISASSTSNPVLFTGANNNGSSSGATMMFNEPSKLNQTTLSNESANKNDGNGYQSRDNYRLMVKDVSDQKLKDFIKNNDLIDLSSTAISINTPTNSPIQIVPQFLKEKRSRIKNQDTTNHQQTNYSRPNTTTNKLHFNANTAANWPSSAQNAFQFQNNNDQQFVNYWPYLSSPYPQNLATATANNKQYNSYTLDNIIEDPSYKYDYVFGLSKVLPSINANFPPFLPDKSFMLKYPNLFADYYSPIDMQQAAAMNAKMMYAQKETSSNNQADKSDQQQAASSSLPSWLKSKFSLKSPISRNTNTNSNPNTMFSNTNNFLHSAASSSFNYPLYELPPPSLLKQQQHRNQQQQQQSPIALPLISSQGAASSQQLNNFLNSPLMSPAQLSGASSMSNAQFDKMINSNLLFNSNALLPTTATSTSNTPQQQQPNSNTRKTFFSQLSRLFSSASMARPVRVPYTAANFASAFSSLTQPFSKLQIDNLSNQLFSPIKGFLNATTAYIPIRKENPNSSPSSSSSNKNAANEPNSDEDELDELEKQILNANGISPYTLNPQQSNQQIAQSTSNLGQMASPLNHHHHFNAYNIHPHPTHHHHQQPAIPLGQSLYGPIKRSHQSTYANQPLVFSNNHPTAASAAYANNLQVRSLMMTNKPTNEIHQQTSTNHPQSSLPFLARHDLMDAYILENDDMAVADEFGLKRSKRKKRSLAYATAPMHAAIHYPPPPPKYSFPFLAPYSINAPAYMLAPPAFFAPQLPPLHPQPMPITNYATPLLPPLMPSIQFATSTSTISNKAASPSSKLVTGESQFKPQFVSSSISPTSAQSSSASPNASTKLSSLSLASAANQLAVSLANISKTHKNNKTLRKHLSKLASSNFLPSISNLTSTLNALESSMSATISNRTVLPKEHTATATVWQRPPGKNTFTTWSFSTIPMNSKEYGLSFTDFPFFPKTNHPTAAFSNSLGSLPAAYLMSTDARSPANMHHPFSSSAYNAIDLNSFAYHTLPSSNYASASLSPQQQNIQKLHIQYRPANAFSKTSSTIITGDNKDNLKSNDNIIVDLYGKRKVTGQTATSANEFRDLLDAYKQMTTNPHPTSNDNLTFKSTANESKEGQTAYNHHQKYSPDYGFPAGTSALAFKSSSSLKESGDDYPQTANQQQNSQTTSKYQSQSSTNRLVKQTPLSSSPKSYSNGGARSVGLSKTGMNEIPKYRDGYASDFDLATKRARKGGKVMQPNFDEDDLEDERQANSGRKIAGSLNDYFYENPGRSAGHQHQSKSMNGNPKLYSSNSKKSFSDNYHETGGISEDDEFFNSKKSDHHLAGRPSGRQLSNRNVDRDSKTDDYEDSDFFYDSDNEQPPNKHNSRLNLQKTEIKHSTGGRSVVMKKTFIPKSSRKSIRPMPSNYAKDEDEDRPSNYDYARYQSNGENNDQLNKNQLLNFRTTAPIAPTTPRSILVKTSSFSFEIPNHSENEEVEFDSDHIGKLHQQPTYTLDQQAARKSLIAPVYSKSSSSTPDYELKGGHKYSNVGLMSSRSNIDHSIKKTEKQKSNSDDDSFNNQYTDIRRQPNNHHLPHSHIEDVEAYYKAAKKSNSKGKFKQFFHQQELKHNTNHHQHKLQHNPHEQPDEVRFKSSSSSKNDATDHSRNEPPEQSVSHNEQPKEKFIGSPPSKPPKFFFNWHSSIDHGPKKQSASNKFAKGPELEISLNNDENNDENETPKEVNNSLNKLKLNTHYNYNNLKKEFNTKSGQQKENHQPPKSMRTPLDDEWFKQDWMFKDLNQQLNNQQMNQQENQQPNHPQNHQQNHQQNQKQNHQQNQQQNHQQNHQKNHQQNHQMNQQQHQSPPSPPPTYQPKPIKTIDNDNDIVFDSGVDLEYEDEVASTPNPVNQQNHKNNNENNQINAINGKTKQQVMDQQNKQYTPIPTTTTTQSPAPSTNNHDNQAASQGKKASSSKNSITPAYKTKFLSSTKFAERQKYKNVLKPTGQPSPPPTPSSTTTTTSTTSASSSKAGKKYEYQKAKLINLQFKKDNNSGKKAESPKLPFTRTTMKPKEQPSDKQQADHSKAQQQSDNEQPDRQANDAQSSKKVIMNVNLQNSSTTLNAQILDKLPISVDSIFDTIDEENANDDYENAGDQQASPKSLQGKKNDQAALDHNQQNQNENLENLNESNENSLNDDLTTSVTSTEQFGTRITGNGGKLQPKVSIKASYSSVSSTVPRAMAQKMDTQRVDSIGFRSLDASDDLSLKRESNGLLKNRMKQFKKHNWLNLQTNNNKNSITTSTSTSSPLNSSEKQAESVKDPKSWKGIFNSRQQKLIDQKKNLDDKSASIIRKVVSPYLSKFRKTHGDALNDAESSTVNATTLKSTATTVPTTTSKSIADLKLASSRDKLAVNDKFNKDKHKDERHKSDDKYKDEKFKSLNRFRSSRIDHQNLNSTNVPSNSSPATNKTTTEQSAVASTATTLKTNYNLNFNNNVNSINNNSSSSISAVQSDQNSTTTSSPAQTKSYKRVFSSSVGGAIRVQHKSRN